MAHATSVKRKRLSVDLTPYPDVIRMLGRAAKLQRGVPVTMHAIDALRKHLTALGYARKKDSAAK